MPCPPSRPQVLLRRSLHKLALDVARMGTASGGSGPASTTTLASIHQRWGDHLYSKVGPGTGLPAGLAAWAPGGPLGPGRGGAGPPGAGAWQPYRP